MKNFLSVLVIIGLIISISSCGKNNDIESPLTVDTPFSLDYPTNEETSKYFLENDDYDVILMSGPYYQGKQSLDFPGMKEFDALRAQKVDEAIELTEDFLASSLKTKKSLEEARSNYIDLLEVLFSGNDTYTDISKEITEILVKQQLQEDALYIAISSIEKSVGEDEAAIAAMEYYKTGLVMKLASKIEENILEFLVVATKTEFEFENNDDVSKELKTFAKKMDKSSIFRNLNANQLSAIDLANTIAQIHTADYYIALTSLAFIEEELPKIKEEISTITITEDVSKEDIEFINDYAKLFETFSVDLKKQLANFDTTTLIDVPADESVSLLFPATYAFGGEFFTKAYGALKSGAKKAITTTVNIVDKGLTYTGVKKKYQQAKKAGGFAVESLQAATKTGFDLALGKYYGNSIKDTGDIIRQNFERMDKNVKDGRAGSDVFHTAYDYIDSIDNGAEYGTELAVSKLMGGKGNVSWAAGKISKLTAGLFTGFAKGVYKVSNQDSSKATIAEGLLDIGLSFVGGSKSVYSGTKALASGGKAALGLKTIGKKGLDFIGKAFANVNKKALKDLTKESVKKFISNGAKNGFNTAMKANYKNMLANAVKKLKDAGTSGLKGLVSGAKIEAKKSYKEFVKNIFKKRYEGYAKTLKSIVGKTAGEFFDNIVGNAVDGEIKGFVKEAIADETENILDKDLDDFVDNNLDEDEEDVENTDEDEEKNGDDENLDEDEEFDEDLDDFVDDYIDNEIEKDDTETSLKDIVGSYPGTMDFTKVYISDEYRNMSKEELGCDISQLFELEGTSVPTTIEITSTGENKGTILMRLEGFDDPQPIPFTYIDGVLTAQNVDEGNVTKIVLKYGKNGFTGGMEMNYDDAIKMTTVIKVKQ